MNHFGIPTQIIVALVVALTEFAVARWRASKRVENAAPAPTSEGTSPEWDSSDRKRTIPVVAVLFIVVSLSYEGYMYVASQPDRHAISFYPGQYRRVVLNSGDAVSAAMKAIQAASDPQALNTAVATVQSMVDAGDAEAAFRLGRYYHLESAEPDYTLALMYYRIAAGKDNAWAINNLGLLYRDGLGVRRNDGLAYEYFQRAALQNNPWAHVNLADMAFSGRAVPVDVSKGIEWLEEGGHNNCTLCLIEEAAIYHYGAYGVQVDRNKTVALLEKAAALGDTQAELIIAELRIVGDGVPQSSRKAFDILKILSDDGDADASTLLGELSSDDKIRDYLFSTALGGVSQRPADLTKAFPQDTARAISYWNRASQQGSCQAWIDLSSVFDRGIGVGTDYQRGADYVERAPSVPM